MNETSKLVEKRKLLGYYDKYFAGNGLEIGGWNDPLVINGKPIKQHTLPDGSSHLLPFRNCEFDFLYASHVLEHFDDCLMVLKEWLRVVKPGGYVYFAVPDFYLYEKGKWPSIFNPAHKSFYSLADAERYSRALSAICEIEFCRLEDNGFDYSLSKGIDQTRLSASCQIDCCLKKK